MRDSRGWAGLSRTGWKLQRHMSARRNDSLLRDLFRSNQEAAAIDAYRQEFAAFRRQMSEGAATEVPKDYRPDYERVLAQDTWFELLFITLRIQRPEAVIETGCATGLATATILQALDVNQHGHAVSIDLPFKLGQFDMNWTLPEDLPIGFLIPQRLRHSGRWRLIEENARTALPRVLQQEEFRVVDVFLHDSDHSFAHQMWEYLTVWPHLREGGLLLSDDIGWSVAFRDFSRSVGREMYVHRSANGGAIRK